MTDERKVIFDRAIKSMDPLSFLEDGSATVDIDWMQYLNESMFESTQALGGDFVCVQLPEQLETHSENHHGQAFESSLFPPVEMISTGQFCNNGEDQAAANNSSGLFDSIRTYCGYIQTTDDALLVFEACRLGRLPRTSRRLSQQERRNIASGSVFVFEEQESGIKRWTDGFLWSPSRILDNFLVYREVDRKDPAPKSLDEYNFPNGSVRGALTADDDEVPLGPLTSQKGTYFFKDSGMIKKTISIALNAETQYHMVSYYRKDDVDAGLFCRPCNDPLFTGIEIPQGLMDQQNFRKPQKSLKEMRAEERSRRRRSSTPYDVPENGSRRSSLSNSSNVRNQVVNRDDINETAMILAGLQNIGSGDTRPRNSEVADTHQRKASEKTENSKTNLPSLPSIFSNGNISGLGMYSITPNTARPMFSDFGGMAINPLISSNNAVGWNHVQYPVKISGVTYNTVLNQNVPILPLPQSSAMPKSNDVANQMNQRQNSSKSQLDINSLLTFPEDQ